MTATLLPLLFWLSTTQQAPAFLENEAIPAGEREAVDACLSNYSKAWIECSPEKMAGLFCSMSPCCAMAREECANFLKTNRVTSCNTTLDFLARSKTSDGTFFGAYARTRLGFRPLAANLASGALPPFDRQLEMVHLFLLRSDPDKARILRMEEIDPEHLSSLRAEKLGCPACNYELMRPAGWFLLPRRRGWSPCTDSLSLLHPSGKIQADFDIVESPKALSLAKIAEEDHRHLIERCAAKPQALPAAARKSFVVGAEIEGLEISGTMARLCEEERIERKESYLRVYFAHGSVLYSLNIYGEAAAFAAQREAIETFKSSFRIANAKLTLPALRESMKFRHNPGGKLERNLYANEQYGVRLQGPNGWKAEDFSGPTLFHVRFSEPAAELARISFHAIEDINGWPDEAAVARTLAQRLGGDAASNDPKKIELRRTLHRGLQAFAYEAEWTGEDKPARRTRICLLPAGHILYLLELEAPAEHFEELRKAYRATLDSLSRF